MNTKQISPVLDIEFQTLAQLMIIKEIFGGYPNYGEALDHVVIDMDSCDRS